MFTLEQLPYSQDALEPYLSANTVAFHYGKHHQTYLDNLNKLIANTDFEYKTIEEIITQSWQDKNMPIFNNAAQVWNHSFYWKSIKPNGGGYPSGRILDLIINSFESYDTFCNEFNNAALTQFGSGWAWVVLKPDQKLQIVKTSNAETPIALGIKPLLTIDVWEHAYYLDYQNKRATYVENFIKHLMNFDFANANLI